MKRIYAALSVLALAAPLAVCQAKVTTAQVNLTWDAPSSSPDPVAGYNVYRAPGGSVAWVQLNPTPLPLTPTAYSDLGPAEGQTWDYIAESVDALGVTSAPSNMASVVIPDFLPPTLIVCWQIN